ncbi:DUF4307 domain-containing protein [Enemella evansiae]|uniref:DUF4307 domain-containing protein n=1 Tax=Enemella evansiae TaxID=2016499 RepID=A0A255GCH5_9ACTN|nr:DUF4307 domain-containing protein [Enemella evansiae]PFG68232.1 uncharacterized protein DUF4307 [Propionibacteriaceae bacterium ES.041]OYO01021.1 hypothetical protein CGZ96_04015 [Enemella evansiae]OYO03130.1 hypothetical protein CGZ95_04910 [Enemella evansiae]OYO03814.1 hypothetical protein CGZ97_10430 [Enemella evansiae]OYO08102.1 hypothetical protein CGZ98_16225 [Enemella evansiae]
MSLSPAERIAARYPDARRPWLKWVVALIVLPLLGVWLWISVDQSNPPVTAQVVSFTVTGNNTINITLMIDRSSADVTGRCLVQATAQGGEQVGEVWYAVAAADREVTQEQVSLRTFRPPVSATISKCQGG